MSAPNFAFSALLVACLACLLRWTTARGFRFSPALLFFFIFVLQQALGCMFLVDDADPGSRASRTGLALGILGFTLGVGAASVWLGFRPQQELPEVRRRFEFSEPDLGAKVLILILGYGVSTAILFAFFHQSGGIPLFQGVSAFLSGDEVRMAQQLLKERRMELTYHETSGYRGQGYMDQIRMVALPYIVPCLILWAFRCGTRRMRWAAVASAGPVLILLLGTGQRHPVLAFLVGMSILGYLVSDPRHHKRILGAFAAAGFVVFFIMTYLLGRYTHTDDFGQDLLMVFRGIWNRLVYSNTFGTMALFELFPNPEPYRWGMTWIRDLQGFLPGPYVAFSAWLYRRLYGAVGTAAPMCFGEMYANFGLPGVFVGGACLGLAFQAFHVVWWRRSRIGVEHLVVYALASMALMRCAVGGLLAPIQHGVVGLPLLYVAVRAGQTFLVGVQSTLRDRARSVWRPALRPRPGAAGTR